MATAKAQVEPGGNYPPHSKAARALVAQGFPPPPPGTPNPESECKALPGRCNENGCNGKEGWCQGGPNVGCPCKECPEKKELCGDTGCFGKEGKCSEVCTSDQEKLAYSGKLTVFQGIHEGCECDEDRRFIPTGTQAMIPIRPTNPVLPPPVCPSRPGQCDACGGDSVQEGVCNGPDLLHCNCCKTSLIPCSDCGGNDGQGRCKSFDSQGRYKNCACKGDSVPATKAAPIGLFPTLDPAQHVIVTGCGVPPHPENVEVPPLSVKM
ncbi:MAG: hypothetical protein Q9223_007157 [Gallowayella weberi]